MRWRQRILELITQPSQAILSSITLSPQDLAYFVDHFLHRFRYFDDGDGCRSNRQLFLIANFVEGLELRTAPIVVEGLIKTEENSERYELRNSDSNSLKLKVPIFRSRAGGQSFSVQGPSIWNNLPKELYVNRKSVFKNSLKRYFLYHYDSKTACSNPRCNDRSHHT